MNIEKAYMDQKEENERLRNLCDRITQERDRATEELSQYKDKTQEIVDRCVQYSDEFRSVIDEIKQEKGRYEKLNNKLALLIKNIKTQSVRR